VARRSHAAPVRDAVEAVGVVTHTLSLISVVHPAYVRYLPELHASIVGQAMPEGWRWEWLVRGNGVTRDAVVMLDDDPRIRFGEDAAGSWAVSRNVALSLAGGDFVRNVDSDDVLLDGALARDIRIMNDLPGIGFTVSAALDVLDDGATVRQDDRPTYDSGVLERGWVLDRLRAQAWRTPILPGTLCARRDLIIMAGGWMDLPGTSDMGLLAAISEYSQGYYNAEPSIYYRRHAGQASIDELTVSPVQRDDHRTLIDERGRLIRTQLD
jgi:glycosyltransferase involved in cell wall biosynthesis